MKKVLTFGEIMMRLNPEGYLKLKQANNLCISFAGGEANVAVSIANFGMSAEFITKVPDNTLGEMAIAELRKQNVDTANVVKGGQRLGLYFVEKGASQRPSKVIYDRAGSAIAMAQTEEFNWDIILEGCTWFHFTGITPALSDSCAKICAKALKACKKKGIVVSCDLNYRKKLWSEEKASNVMKDLMQYVDICIANESDAADVFAIKAEKTDVESGELDKNGYISVAKQLTERFGFSKVAITLRKSISASENDWSGMLYENDKAYFSKEYHIKLVDRVGGGDSFAGALIYALHSGFIPQKAIDFAAAASCLKQTIEYDFNISSLEDVTTLMNGNGSGRVQR